MTRPIHQAFSWVEQIAGPTGPCIDGVDVTQLLRDLGEASAAGSAVDLFGLCLKAQRVLERVQATHMECARDGQ